jgi:hypothetical protein
MMVLAGMGWFTKTLAEAFDEVYDLGEGVEAAIGLFVFSLGIGILVMAASAAMSALRRERGTPTKSRHDKLQGNKGGE